MPTPRQVCFVVLASGGILCAMAGFTMAIIIFQTTNNSGQHDYMPLYCAIGFAAAGIVACAVGLAIFCASQRKRRSVRIRPEVSFIEPDQKNFPVYTTV